MIPPPAVLPTRHRWLIRRDLPAVLAIERATAAPWAEADFLHCLRQRACVGFVAERDDRVIGFMIYTLADGAIRLENLAVHPALRRRGVGAGLVRKLVSRLRLNRRGRVEATVRETNGAAIGLFRSAGFRATGLVRGAYADTGEDGYRFEFRDPDFDPAEACDHCGREVRRS